MRDEPASPLAVPETPGWDTRERYGGAGIDYCNDWESGRALPRWPCSRRDGVQDVQPDWSPDRRKFAFTSDASGNPDIWVIDADGEDARQLTADPAVDERPAWRPPRDHDVDEDD